MNDPIFQKLKRDLSESRRTIAQLNRKIEQHEKRHQSRQKIGTLLKTTLETSSDHFFAVDLENRLIFINSAFRKFFFQLHNAELKLHDHIFQAMAKERRRFWQDQIAIAISEGACRFDQQYFIEDTRYDLEWTGTRAMADGNAIGVVMCGRETTALRRAEETLRERDAQLHHAQKLEAVGTLAGRVAHEFNNTLSIVLGNLELCIIDIHKEHPARPYIDDAKTGILRAKKVARQLLDFSRRSDGQKQNVDVHTLVTNALSLLRASIPTHIEFHQHIEICPPVVADPSHIHQLIINLCTNAADAMDEEGGVMTVTLEYIKFRDGRIPEHLPLAAGHYAKLTVADTGRGVTADTVAREEPRQTGKKPLRNAELGLNIVKGIAQKYGGCLVTHAKIGRGSKFEVYLPTIKPAQAAKKAPLRPEPSDVTGRERILLVDDEPKFVIITQRQLEYLGYKVEIFTSSKNALERFKASPDDFDLIISDVAMPKMTGENLAKQIRQVRPNLPVILCTGYSEKVDQHTAERLGCEYLIKPIEMEHLGQVIRKVLDQGKKKSSATKKMSPKKPGPQGISYQ